ncbi:hypothetical protein Sjap_000052 [Stephania japonica]|uniref:Nucleoprotein TPR/MLP1 domain-containing protein n=1 Tax=Stephania japonica TaxID=461633 RepID=A0AAP0PQD2_9MAGN
MPLFLSDEEFERCSHDACLIAERADAFIRDLYRQIETVRAQSEAAAITAEQTCSLLEHKYISLSNDFSKLESENAQLLASIERKVSELAQVQADKHQLHIKDISKDGEIERLSIEAAEHHKSKRQLLELLEQKDIEISEKNATINSYLDKIVNLSDNAANKEARVLDMESESAHSRAACARLSQEKEIFERHNVWLNEELTAKIDNLNELRRTHTELEADLSSKLADVEKQLDKCSSSLKRKDEKVKELEMKLMSVQEELCLSRETATRDEDRYSAEISTTAKLIELYKESSEEWAKKAGELEGVIKALETHLSQVESDYKEKLEKEISIRKEVEKEAAEMKLKLEKCEAEMENSRKANELSLLPIDYFTEENIEAGETNDDRALVPRMPTGVSGTALAASLLRDGWSLAKMYEKYQETVDALRHERLGRKQSQAILERVLFEIEEKAEVILDERAEHERMMEAYSMMNQKLQQSLSEQSTLERTVQELKAELRRQEREYDLAQKDILDLQKQVTVLLKECRDIQLRYGAVREIYPDDSDTMMSILEFDAEKVISEQLLTFKDINGLVEQNVKLRSLVHNLSDDKEKRDKEIKEQFESELQKQADEAASKVTTVLKRAEEQASMIESLHSSVAMYKRLYEEELKLHRSYPQTIESGSEPGRTDIMRGGSQGVSKKVHEKTVERIKSLEEQIDKARIDLVSLRLERDKFSMESSFAKEKLDSFIKEFEHQRDEMNGVLARNIEFSQLIVNYQRKLRDSSDSLLAAEEVSRKSTMEVSILKHEKELLKSSENRACDEVRNLSERVHRLQASLEAIHSAEEIRENARAMERKGQEEYLKRVEREWAETKKELQEERDNVRSLTLDREQTIKNAMKQVEEMGKQLADALRALAAAEAKAAIAEARCSDLEANLKSSQNKVLAVDAGCGPVASLATIDLPGAKDELDKLKEEVQASKDHMLQYKNIAQVNEAALKQMESAHEKFKAEAGRIKKSLEDEIYSLQATISELESDSVSKSKEVASIIAEKEDALDSAKAEIANLKEENSAKMSQVMGMEIQISSLKEDLEKEHQRWRTAQSNYERQVILQSETIQELTKTSQALASLQEEASELRKSVDTLRNENDMLKAQLESEKSALEQSWNEADKKYNEINDQNKILHNRLESLHITLAEKERTSAGISSGISDLDTGVDGGLQAVVNYLRRSKEIAETEISLLKQEKMRLQSQLESALKASEAAQALLRDERSKSRALLFSDEEFKSLQIQVREINLLRESNLQLREENKHNFEECQKLREVVQKVKVEAEQLENLLHERQIEVDSLQKEINLHKEEKLNLENRIVELVETSRNIDLEDYNRLKDTVGLMEVKLRDVEAELEETRKLVSVKQDAIVNLEHDLMKCRTELAEKEKRINESVQLEAALRSDVERRKKFLINTKKQLDALSREREELVKEKELLSKQLEESKQSKRPAMEIANEQANEEKDKEKDTRIQILEKTLEREREKEKASRAKTEKAVMDAVKKFNETKKMVMDELEKHKQSRDNFLENLQSTGASATQLPSETDLNNKTTAYQLAVENVEKALNSTGADGAGARGSPDTSTLIDTSTPAPTSVQVPVTQALTVQSSVGAAASRIQSRAADEKEKRPIMPRPRKLQRPKFGLPEKPSGDTEMSEADTSLGAGAEVKREMVNDAEAQAELQPTQTSARKRVAVPSSAELHDESHSQLDANPNVAAPLTKKSRGSDSPQKDVEVQPVVPVESLEVRTPLDETMETGGDVSPAAANAEIGGTKELDIFCDPADLFKASPFEGLSQSESQSDLSVLIAESMEKSRDGEGLLDEGLNNEDRQDTQQLISEIENEREDGELPPEMTELPESSDVSPGTASPELEVPQELVAASDALPSGLGEDTTDANAGEAVETVTSDTVLDEKNDAGEVTEDIAEEDKSGISYDQVTTESMQSPQASFGAGGSSPKDTVDPNVSKGGNVVAPSGTDDAKEGSSAEGSRIISLSERAKLGAAQRQRGQIAEPPPPTRPRGRLASTTGGRKDGIRSVRGRGIRGGRGRGSDDKGRS